VNRFHTGEGGPITHIWFVAEPNPRPTLPLALTLIPTKDTMLNVACWKEQLSVEAGPVVGVRAEGGELTVGMEGATRRRQAGQRVHGARSLSPEQPVLLATRSLQVGQWVLSALSLSPG
jgi:hypothetical protein